jgi:hypothetical protein
MSNNILIHYDHINKNTRIDTSDRVEVTLDKHLIDLQKLKKGEKRLNFSIEEELILVLCLTGVTRYQFIGVDISLGLVYFKILNIAKWSYSNRIFREKFELQTMIDLPDVFCLEFHSLNFIWNAYNNMNDKHGYNTLKDLADVKPNRKKKLIEMWEENGANLLRVLCQFNQLKKLEKIGKEAFLENVTRSKTNDVIQ